MEWKPIETAPKDGTRVLLFCSGRIIIGFYHKRDWDESGIDTTKVPNRPYEGWLSEEITLPWQDLCPLIPEEGEVVTHWMPLPDEPLIKN